MAVALTGLGCASPPHSTRVPAPGAGAPLATWVWDEGTVLSPERQQRLLAFGRAKGVRTIYLHASASYESEAGFDSLVFLLSAAREQGVGITLVAGDPAWIHPERRSAALALIERTQRLNARLSRQNLALNGQVLYDVEPYLLPEWRSSPEQAARDYLALLDAVHAAGRAASLEVWQTIPFWFGEQFAAGESLERQALRHADGAVVMAYRNHASNVAALARPVLEDAGSLDKPVIVAVETACVEPSYVSFCGTSAPVFARDLQDLHRALRAFPAFAGLAVHQQATWQALVDEAE